MAPRSAAGELEEDEYWAEELVGCEDDRLIDVCRNENRCLVTLDKEFGNPLIYPPRNYAGIVLLRLPQRNGKIEMLAAIDGLMNAVAELETSETLQGRLWIAQPDRVREYRARSEDDSED